MDHIDPSRLEQLVRQTEEELKRILHARPVTKDDLDAMEKRLTTLIKGEPLHTGELVKESAALQADAKSLQDAIDKNKSA